MNFSVNCVGKTIINHINVAIIYSDEHLISLFHQPLLERVERVEERVEISTATNMRLK